MAHNLIVYQKKGYIVWITLNFSAQGNIINLRMARELDDACSTVNQDNEVRVVIITGSGDSFCRGVDLGELQSLSNPAYICSRAVAGLDRPTIAAINGDALGAGLELALCCDIRICSENVQFGFPETSYGLIPGGGGTQRLPRIIGRGKATEMILTADLIDSNEAYRIGLVNRVVLGGRLTEAVQEVADKLISRAPIAVRYAKEAVIKGMDLTLDQGLRLEGDLSFILQSTEDRAAGIKAFIEKRKAEYKGA